MKGFSLREFRVYVVNPDCEKTETDEEKPKHGSQCSPIFNQTLAALGPLLLSVAGGMTFGYSAILIPQLQSQESTFTITREEGSWIASMAALPMAIGSICGGILIEKLGRKTTHIINCPLKFLGWFLLYFANGVNMIYAGRFVTGFSMGIIATSVGVYIGETAQPSYRGFLLASMAFCISLGMFLSHLFGTFFSWQITALLCSVLPLLSMMIAFFTPESPSWLINKKRIDEAEKSFYWCRGTSEEAKLELEKMLERNYLQSSDKKSIKAKINELLVPEFLKPLGVIGVYIVANQWAGINAMTFYYVSIMKNTIGEDINEYVAMLIIDFLRLFGSTLACFLLKKYKRRTFAIISGVGACISLFFISFYSFLIKFYPEFTIGYIPLACLGCYIIFVCIGFLPLPWAMIGEIFPLKHRSVGSGMMAFIAFVTFFSVVKTLPGLFENCGSGVTFLIFGLVTLVATIFIYFYLPETKGRTLQDIEDEFRNKNTVNNASN